MQRFFLFAAVLVGIVLVLTGCFVNAVEGAIASSLTEKIGPADSYVVKLLNTTDNDVQHGILHALKVDGTHVHPKNAPVIDHFAASLEDVVIDMSTKSFKSAKHAQLSIEVRDQDIVTYLRSVQPQLKTLRMLVLNDHQVVFMVDSLKLRFVGSIVMNGLQVEFQLQDATEGGAPMDPDEASIIVDEINPIADLSTWPLTVSTAKLSLTPGKIGLTASIDRIDAAAFSGKAGATSSPLSADRVENPKDHQVLVVVPSGKATIGRDGASSEETPAHSVGLQSYLLGEREVTNQQFGAFVEATHYVTTAEKEGTSAVWSANAWRMVPGASWQHPGGGTTVASSDLPVVHVSRQDAEAYCAWAGLRLPTEEEWEWAARGKDALAFPWGTTFETSRCNSSVGQKAPTGGPVAVGGYANGAAPFGNLDMAGNVWEWTSSACARYPGNKDSKFYDETKTIIRGGSWAVTDEDKLRTTARSFGPPTMHNQQLGFRCAQSR